MKRTTRRPEPLEHNIQLQIMEYLRLKYPDHYVWRNNSGALKAGRQMERFVQFGKPGSADILGCAPDGKIIALEVKRPSTRKNTTPLQEMFLYAISSRGGYAGVVCSIEDVDAILGR